MTRLLGSHMAGVLDLVYVALVFLVAAGGVFGVYFVTRDTVADGETRMGFVIAAVVTLFVIGVVWPLVA